MISYYHCGDIDFLQKIYNRFPEFSFNSFPNFSGRLFLFKANSSSSSCDTKRARVESDLVSPGSCNARRSIHPESAYDEFFVQVLARTYFQPLLRQWEHHRLWYTPSDYYREEMV